MKCHNCGAHIFVYSANDGSVHILEREKRGSSMLDWHYCLKEGRPAKYSEILSKRIIKQLDLEGVDSS